MSRAALRHCCLALACTAALAGLLAVSGGELHAAAPRIVVRLVDTADTATTRATATQVASDILAEAGVDVAWRDCTPTGGDLRCTDGLSRGEFIVRIMRRYVPRGDERGGGPDTTAITNDDGLQLGFAALDPRSHRGVLATIYHDRVVGVAMRARVSHARLLGRAIAHELGHLLLRGDRHGESGLMRAVWTDGELARERQADWLFTPGERQRLVRLAADAGRAATTSGAD